MKIWIPVIILSFIGCTSSSTKEKQSDIAVNENGRMLFEQNCRSCHLPTKSFTAPPFQMIRKYMGNDWVYKIVKNNGEYYGKDARITMLIDKGKGKAMTAFPNLSNADIDAICNYVDSFPFDLKSPEYADRK